MAVSKTLLENPSFEFLFRFSVSGWLAVSSGRFGNVMTSRRSL